MRMRGTPTWRRQYKAASTAGSADLCCRPPHSGNRQNCQQIDDPGWLVKLSRRLDRLDQVLSQ